MARKGYRITNTKFLRRSIIVICVLVFLVVCVIVTGFMTVVKNVNVSYVYVTVANFTSNTYEVDFSDAEADVLEDGDESEDDESYETSVAEIPSRYAEEFEKSTINLESLKKSNLIFLRENKIEDCVSAPARIKVTSYTKKYPCSLDVVLEERVETFTSFDEEKNLRTIYDSYGDVMESIPNDRSVLGDDGSPDIEISAGLSEEDVACFVEALDAFEECFSSARRLISFMDVSNGDLYIELRFGLEIIISDCSSLLAEKIGSAYEVYDSLDDWQKTCGRIVTDVYCRSEYAKI
ncbi:MAG: hypothetical protein LUD72_02440 [Bacteroidales bacterium]|nr:hypothetical protein [Bacteroidales bacterium]